jgi:hypothetical protein
MERVDAAALAFKIAGIYVMVEAVKLVPNAAIYLRNVVGDAGVTARDLALIGAPLLVACAALAILAYILIAFSRRFGQRALAEPTQEAIDFQGEARDLQAVAFSVIGLVLLASAVPELVNDIAGALHSSEQIWSFLRSQAPDLIVLFLQLSAGYWLFFAPRSVRRAWEWLGGRLGDERRNVPPTDPPA